MADKKKVKEPEETTQNSFAFVYGEALTISKEKQVELVEKYHQHVLDFLSARKDKETEWQNDAYILSNQRTPKSTPWQNCSNVALGMAAEKTDTLAETILSRMNAGERVYNMSGEDDFSKEHEEEVESWFNYQLDNPQEFNDIDTYIRALAKDDTAVMTLGMEREVVNVKKWVNIKAILADKGKNLAQKAAAVVKNIVGRYEIDEKKVVTIRHTTTVLRIEDVIVPVGAKNNIQKEPFVGYFDYKTFDQLKAMNTGRQYYVNLDDENFKTKQTKTTEQDSTKKNEQDAKIEVKDTGSRLKNCVLYIKEDIDNDGELEGLIMVYHFDSKTFLRLQYNQSFHGKRSMLATSSIPNRDNFFGTSIPSIIRPLQLECESIVNQMMDNWDLVIKKIFLRIRGAKLTIGNKDGDDNEIFPGAVVEGDTEKDLTVLNVGSVDYNSMPLINKYMGFISSRAGFSAADSGGGDPTDPRASGKKVALMMSQGSIRIDAIFKRFNNVMAERAKLLISNYAQYANADLTYQDWDEGTKDFIIKKLDPKILQECKFKITLNGLQYSTSREEEKQEELWLYETVNKSPLMSQPPMNLSQMADTQLEAMFESLKQLVRKYGRHDAERMIPDLQGLKNTMASQITAQIEQKMKDAAKLALAGPKAQPHEIARHENMADNVTPEDMAAAGGAGGQ